MKTNKENNTGATWLPAATKPWTAAVFVGAVSMFAHTAFAVDAKKPPSTADLAKASQNPVSSMISVPFENNATFNNGPDDVFVDVLNIKPVIPMSLSADWNLINRAIIPVVYQADGFTGQTHVGGASIGQHQPTTDFTTKEQDLGSLFGIGDIVYQGFISPKKTGKLIWGAGAQLNIPTGMDRLTSDQWSLGPAAVALTMPGHWVIGALASNVWSIGGYNDAPDVNAMTLQPFVNYNMKKGWYLSSGPVITANWEADSGQQWTVPIGGGAGRVFKMGKQHVNMKLAAYYNVEAPDDATDWNLQLEFTLMFPK